MVVSENRQIDFMNATSESLKHLFDEQKRFLDFFFDRLDYAPLENFCKWVLDCTGKIIFSGVGKSGFIAQKISQTLVSTGTQATYLNPTDALHGDIGIVSSADIVVLFSKSGGTEELLKLVPFCKAKGARIVSVTCVPENRLHQACDMAITLPLERELCPFDLAPVTSTAIQMLFGDTIAIALMRAKHLTKEEYAMNHPAGRIGKRLMLRVSDVMVANGDMPLVEPETTLVNALQVLTSKGCGCVLVADEERRLLGTFTDGDLRRKLQRYGCVVMSKQMSELMTEKPRTTTPGEMAVACMAAMETPRRITFMPVVEDETLVGLVTLHGLVSSGI